MVESKDLIYLVFGAALLGLTALPLICGKRIVSMPTVYILAGAVLAFLPIPWVNIDPRGLEWHLMLIEHATELIVIVALAAGGLAIDRQAGRSEWQHAWVLLGVTMPLTIVAVFGSGLLLGLGLSGALLLAAALAPTDPVLAREVQVGGPTEGKEDDVRLSLTTESGLNDGLAFPFVWFAIVVAQAGGEVSGGLFADWVLRDVIWRIAIALGVAYASGRIVGWFAISRWGDRAANGRNAALVFLGSTLLTYGATEALDGYGFLAVFVAARVGRGVSRDTEYDDYVMMPHAFGEQFESILLGILLLWLGTFAVSGALDGWRWSEVGFAFLLIFVLRPVAGWIGLICTRGTSFERFAISFFGIRGMGTFFYVAYAASHADFADIDIVWRISVICVLLSVLVHGMLAPIIMTRLPSRQASNAEPAE